MTAPRSAQVETEAFLAFGSFALFSFVAVAVLFHVIPAANEKYAMLMLGALIGIVKDTFGRYLQATKGSAQQRDDAAEVTRALVGSMSTVPTPGPADAPDHVSLAPGDEVTVSADGRPAK